MYAIRSYYDLELVAIYEQDIADNKEFRDRMEDQADIFGADDKTYRTVIYKYDSRYYKGGFSLLEYDGLWYIMDLSDPVSGIPSTGMLIEMQKKDVEDYLD